MATQQWEVEGNYTPCDQLQGMPARVIRGNNATNPGGCHPVGGTNL